jgi:hypothetical protein
MYIQLILRRLEKGTPLYPKRGATDQSPIETARIVEKYASPDFP